MKYIKELDSLRAIAALMVIFNHWIPQYYWLAQIPFAAMGVTIFFVLSGFLITWILLENKKKVDEGDLINPSVLKSFYIRRTLRIFPIYYLTIFALYFAHKYLESNISFNFSYFLTYTSNFYFFKIKSFDALGSHLWSLAVEEQFYLFWPVVILLTKKRYLVHVIFGFIVVGIVSEIVLRNQQFGFLITTSCFYVFGAGALLAWLIVYKKRGIDKLYKILRVLIIVPLVYYLLTFFRVNMGFSLNHNRPVDSIIAFFLVTLLVRDFFNDQKPVPGFIWENKYLIFLGKISYGIYLYHPFVSIVVYKLFVLLRIDKSAMLPYHFGDWVFIFICFIMLLGISWLSWVLIEKPLLNLKKYFKYDNKKHLEFSGQPV